MINLPTENLDSREVDTVYTDIPSCGRQKGPSMMTRYARSYSLQKGPI